MSRHALECGLLAGENRDVAIHVAGAAGIAGHAAAVGPARDLGQMRVHVVALGRTVARRMAVHAARVHDHLGGLGEQRAGACLLIRHASERRGRAQLGRSCASLAPTNGISASAARQETNKVSRPRIRTASCNCRPEITANAAKGSGAVAHLS